MVYKNIKDTLINLKLILNKEQQKYLSKLTNSELKRTKIFIHYLQ